MNLKHKFALPLTAGALLLAANTVLAEEETSPAADLGDEVVAQVNGEDISLYYRLVSELEQEDDLDALQIAAALARIARGDTPLLLAADVSRLAPAAPTGDAAATRPRGASRRSP